ncbi:hypothetical protein Agabi119p4_9958 [Agaricus bisporus var. burnettii]|nr:hypothetical protein Agabi119p4_9958 [Agaricus bisporus var. burnettii]
MTCDDAYAALRHLLSVLTVPERDKAHEFVLQCFHKSFIDYISDFSRSGLFSDIEHEAHHLEVQCTFRILEQAPDGIDFGDRDYAIYASGFCRVGVLACGPGTGCDILPTWPADEEHGKNTRLEMYKLSVGNVVEGIRNKKSAFCTQFCIRLVTARWCFYDFNYFPYEVLENLVFERSRRHEFIEHGILKQIPVKAFLYTNVVYRARLQFRRPTTTVANLSDPWKSSCRHERTHDRGQSKEENWRTEFKMSDIKCRSCCQRLEAQLEKWKTRYPDHLVTVLFTSTYTYFVEFQFVDPDDGVSEWTYWFVYEIEEEERRKLGSPL